jgi:hypothetical protein
MALPAVERPVRRKGADMNLIEGCLLLLVIAAVIGARIMGEKDDDNEYIPGLDEGFRAMFERAKRWAT